MADRIMIADDHDMFRESLRALLESRGHSVLGEAASGPEAVRLARRLNPDIAIMDITMPGLNGVDATRAILRDSPRTRVIALTVHTEESCVFEALRAGVRAYVLKTQAATDLLQAIKEISSGAIYLSPGISRVVVEASLSDSSPSPDPLTPREREVIQLVAEGRTTKEIAVQLRISVKTAESHRNRIMKKLDIHNTAGLVRYAIARGLIEP